MPTGQEFTNSAMAVIISGPANQSATILVSNTLMMTPPTPAMTRPMVARA